MASDPFQDLKPYGDEYGWTMFHSGTPWLFRNGMDRDPMPDEVHVSEAAEFLEGQHDAPFLLTVGFSRPTSISACDPRDGAISATETGEEELYDHQTDPHEWENQSKNPESRNIFEEMRFALRELIPGK
jgi:hypothetical protein